MKLIRYGTYGKEKPGVVLDDGKKIDVSRFTPDFDEAFFTRHDLDELGEWVRLNAHRCPRIDPGERLGCPVGRPSKLVCVGLNYARHAAESGMEIPEEPVLFFKATSSIVGPNDDLVLPRNSRKTDWEVELAFVVGKRASYVSREEALAHVAGYVLHNDYSEREFQLERSGQWVKGKSCDTFAPLGPWLVPAAQVEDPNNLGLWLKVNGKTMQESNTSDFVFRIDELVHYISQFMTLLPGDIVSTGTPPGVGLGLDPPQYLKPGDVVELGIEGLGTAKQHVKAFPG